MPAALTFLLSFQLLGLVLVSALGLAIPEPVIGLILMFVWIHLKFPIPAELGVLCEGLLKHLSLLFVPAAVGLITYVDLLAEHWVPVFLALLISTPLSIAAGAWTFSKLAGRMGMPPQDEEIKSDG
ncbi:MAG: CidA/LrgA family protein [Litorivicinus sp.]